MRPISWRILVLPLLLAGTVQGENLLLNPSFEIEDPEGGIAPADWTSVGDYISRSDDVAHTGDWSMMIDNEQPNSFGQWKQIRPAEWSYEVEFEDELHQSLWIYVDEDEEPPVGTAVHLLTRWNGLVPQASDVAFQLVDYPLGEWFQIEQFMVVPELDADGNEVVSATATFYVNTNNDAEDLGGILYYDDARWGPEGDPVAKPGDYNVNGQLDAGDLDLHASEGIANQNLDYDANGDGVVDVEDRVVWTNDLKNTWMGDADLNGVFDSSDFVIVFGEGKYETGDSATWGQGDWNGDLVFDSGDFVAAFGNGGYEMGEMPGGPNPVAATVPEPSGAVLLLAAAIAMVVRRRRR